jgi:hypothetical protein
MDLLGFISSYSPFFNHFWIASRLVCSFCEVMPESLSVANTAITSANFAVVDSVEFDRSAVYSKCNNGPRTGKISACSVPTFTRKCLLCREHFSSTK